MNPLLPRSCLLLLGLSAFASIPTVAAEPPAPAAPTGRWVVVPASTAAPAERTRAVRSAGGLIKALSRRGARVSSLHVQAAAFRRLHSREPRAISRDDIDEFLARAERVRQAYAFERRAAALREMNEALEIGRRAQASLMRDNRAASRFLDTCLLGARHALERQHDRQAARRIVLACLLEAIDVPPTRGEHPPEVTALIEEVQREIEGAPGGKLVVHSAPEGCDVFIGGRFSAKTNAELTRPLHGEYPIQVECEDGQGSGRVHVRELGEGVVTLEVDTAFETAIRTGDGADDSEAVLRLQFQDAAALRAHADAYARRVGEVLGADRVVLVTAPSQGRAHALLLRGPAPMPEATVTLSRRAQPGPDVADAARVLVAAAAIADQDLCTEAVVRLAATEGDAAARQRARGCPDDPAWRAPTVPAYPARIVAHFDGVEPTVPAGDVAGVQDTSATAASQVAVAPSMHGVDSAPAARSGAGPWPYVVAGTGALMLGGAVVTGLMVADAEQELLDAGCADGCDARYDDTRDRGRTLRTTTNILLGAGLAAVAGGAIFWWLDGGFGEQTQGDAQAQAWAPALDCGPDYCGVAAHGRF